VSTRPTRPARKSARTAPHLLGRAGLGIIGVFIVGVLGLSIVLASPSLRSGQLAAVVTARLVDLTNKDRASDTLATLTVSPVLTAAAQAKANDMAKKGYFAHTSPEGLDSWHWFKQEGYSFAYAGENLAVDFTDSDDVNRAWLDSPTHRANILNGHFTEIGIATAKGTYEGHSTTFVVQMFGTPAKPSPITEAVQPADPKELAVARTGASDETQVLGASAEPVQKTPASTKKIAVSEPVAGAAAITEVVQKENPTSGVSVPDEYAPFWGRFAASPHSLLRTVYICFALLLAVALLMRTGFEFRKHHMKHVAAVLSLLILMSALFFVADRFVFLAPVVGTGQSI